MATSHPSSTAVQHPQHLVGAVGQVGVGEGDRPAPGGQHPDPHRGPLAPVAGLDDDLGGAGGQGGVGGGVVGAVVDHHDLDPAVVGDVGQPVAQAAHRVADAVGLAVTPARRR